MPRRAGASDLQSSGGGRVERGDAAPDRRRYRPDGRPAPHGVVPRAVCPVPGCSDREWAEDEWHGPRPDGRYGEQPVPPEGYAPEGYAPAPEGYPDPYDGPAPERPRPRPGARSQAGRRIPPTMQRGPGGPGPGPNGAVASDPRRAGGPRPGTARA